VEDNAITILATHKTGRWMSGSARQRGSLGDAGAKWPVIGKIGHARVPRPSSAREFFSDFFLTQSVSKALGYRGVFSLEGQGRQAPRKAGIDVFDFDWLNEN